MARGLAKYAPPEYTVQLFCHREFTLESACHFDAVLFMSWCDAIQVPIRRVVLAAADAMTLPLGALGTTRKRNRWEVEQHLPGVDGVICVTRRLEAFCGRLAPSTYIPAGVDLEAFQPRTRATGKHLRVGWCGQVGGASPKGYQEVLLPLMQRLPQVDWRLNTRSAATALSQMEMAAWYRSLDVLLCTSANEGCQMPQLEAAATGVPVIATPAGDSKRFKSFVILRGWEHAQQAPAVVDEAESVLLELMTDWHWALGPLSRGVRREIEEKADWRILAPQWLEYVAG
jgi:glycosyltransferase involved in cell wall biosynthesis